MFDHVTIRAADRASSERFYRTVLGAIGVEPTYAGEELIEWDDFSILAADDRARPTRHLHVGFVASTWRFGASFAPGFRNSSTISAAGLALLK